MCPRCFFVRFLGRNPRDPLRGASNLRCDMVWDDRTEEEGRGGRVGGWTGGVEGAKREREKRWGVLNRQMESLVREDGK